MDARTRERIRVACRDEAELQRLKEAAQKPAAEGARVLPDELDLVKVHNAKQIASLDRNREVRAQGSKGPWAGKRRPYSQDRMAQLKGHGKVSGIRRVNQVTVLILRTT
jgi:hypothetical protein